MKTEKKSCIEMKKYLTAILLLLSTFTYGQIIDELPKDKNGKLCFSDEIKAQGKTKNDLYLSALQLIVNNHITSHILNIEPKYDPQIKYDKAGVITDVLLEDKESGIIVVKGLIEMREETLGFPTTMYYTLKLQIKDGSYKYKISNIIYSEYLKAINTCSIHSNEWFFDKKSYYKKNGKAHPAFDLFRSQTLEMIKTLVDDIKSGLLKEDVSIDEKE